MVSISYHVVLKMIKFPIALFLKLNIHHVTNTQYLQPSNCWEDNCSFNPQLLLYKFRNFIIFILHRSHYYFQLKSNSNSWPNLIGYLLSLSMQNIHDIFILSCCLPQSDHICLCQLLEQSINYSSCSPRLCHNSMRP